MNTRAQAALDRMGTARDEGDAMAAQTLALIFIGEQLERIADALDDTWRWEGDYGYHYVSRTHGHGR